jgi:hypothetical protein
MKLKLMIIVALGALSFCAQAQTEKGKNLIGGAIAYRKSNGETDNSNGETYSITVAPNYGYFVHKNLAIGVLLGYARIKQNNESQGNYVTPGGTIFTTITQKGVNKVYYGGPFIRHYFDIVDKFKIYNQFSGTYGKGTQRISSQYSNFENEYSSYSARINSGLTFFPVKKIAIELGFELISYTREKTNVTDSDVGGSTQRSNTFNIGFDSFNPSIGVNFHF